MDSNLITSLLFLFIGGGIVYLIKQKPQYDDTAEKLKRNKLDREIKELEKILKEEPKDLTPEQVEDYWNKK